MTQYKTTEIDNLDIFYREAGSPEQPSILLLHGFPSSSHMYRNLIDELKDDYHLVAPDYPGFGYSGFPRKQEFDYSFDRISEVIEAFCQKIGLTSFSPFMQDYGAPVGFRIAERNPDWIQTLLIQNGNAYKEGIGPTFDPIRELWNDRNEDTEQTIMDLFTLETTRWQYHHGASNPELISPDSYTLDQFLMDRPKNKEMQLELQYDYRNNVKEYPKWHAYFEEHQPPALVVWGKNDTFFPADGARAYEQHLDNLEVHLLDSGHFPLEEYADVTATFVRKFLTHHLQ
jgi:pimeloyl-ACP methyl ester carboxylesterase